MNYYPYIRGQEIISFDENGKQIKNIDDYDNEDISYTTIKQLQDCIYENDFVGFKKNYEEYICNENIIDHFKFDDEEHGWLYNTYSLCTCIYKNEEPTYIHKHMNIRACSCSNGKRYLTYLCAYNSSFLEYCYFYDTNNKCSEKYETKEINNNLEKIKNYLKENGPIDLSYTSLYYKK